MPEWAWKPLWQIYPEWHTNFGPFFFSFLPFFGNSVDEYEEVENQSLEVLFTDGL